MHIAIMVEMMEEVDLEERREKEEIMVRVEMMAVMVKVKLVETIGMVMMVAEEDTEMIMDELEDVPLEVTLIKFYHPIFLIPMFGLFALLKQKRRLPMPYIIACIN